MNRRMSGSTIPTVKWIFTVETIEVDVVYMFLLVSGCPSQDSNSHNSDRDDELRVGQLWYEQTNEFKYNPCS